MNVHNIITSEADEALMRNTLLKCYSEGPLTFRVSKEHYLYLAEQIISLREGSRRAALPLLLKRNTDGKDGGQ